MVCREPYHSTQGIKGVEIAIECLVKPVGFWCAWGVLVLDIVRQRQVEQVGGILLQQAEPRFHDELTELTRVDLGRVPPNEGIHLVDAVFSLRRLMRLFS